MFLSALRENDTEMMDCIIGLGLELIPIMFARPIRKGDLRGVTWLFENNCPWGKYTFSHAIVGGNMDIMEYILENGAPLNSRTFYRAACIGNIEIMQWLLNNGCPYDLRVLVRCKQSFQVSEWVKENLK